MEFEIALPPDLRAKTAAQIVDDTLAQRGLTVTLRDALKQYPGCTHWHLKQGRQTGTLEITLWPQRHRVWFSVHRNRTAPWIKAEIERLHTSLQSRLNA